MRAILATGCARAALDAPPSRANAAKDSRRFMRPRSWPRLAAPSCALHHLDRERRRLAAADAERGDALLPAVLLQRAEQRDDDSRAARADRMAERDRAAVHVDDLVRQRE